MQLMHDKHGITQHEHAKMATKLLINYGKMKENKIKKEKKVLEQRAKNLPSIHFVDNDAVRFALIKGSSSTPDPAWLAGRFREEEARSG